MKLRAKIQNMNLFGRKAWKVLLVLALAFMLGSCADVNGLHNQEAATVTFVFVNFPVEDGAYAIPGEHNDWDNTVELVTIKNGSGTSSAVSYAASSLEFSLVKANSWLRLWSKTDGGTINGSGRTGADYYRNFLAEGITLGSDVTITIDGSAENAEITVE